MSSKNFDVLEYLHHEVVINVDYIVSELFVHYENLRIDFSLKEFTSSEYFQHLRLPIVLK